MADFETCATFITHPDHHRLFKEKDLLVSWAKSYPMIFDEDDIRIAENQARLGYHFYEWLAAILLYHTEGLFSLVEQYQLKPHFRKESQLRELTSLEIVEYLQSHPEFGGVQCPDLLVYKPDYSDWFFCEVKGPADKLRGNQVSFFEELERRCGKPVKLIEFTNLESQH